MASLPFDITQLRGANLKEVQLIAGGLVTNGSTPSISKGKGFTVSQQGTGLYRVTFNKAVPRIVAALPALIKAATSDTQVEVLEMVDASSTTTGYVTFRVVKTSDGTVVAPGAVGDIISFLIVCMAVKLPVT